MSQEEWHRETSPFNNLLQINLSLENFILYSPSKEPSPKKQKKCVPPSGIFNFNPPKNKKQRANLCLTGVIKWHQPNFHSLLQGKSLKLISNEFASTLDPPQKNVCGTVEDETTSNNFDPPPQMGPIQRVFSKVTWVGECSPGYRFTSWRRCRAPRPESHKPAESRLDGFSRPFLRRGICL